MNWYSALSMICMQKPRPIIYVPCLSTSTSDCRRVQHVYLTRRGLSAPARDETLHGREAELQGSAMASELRTRLTREMGMKHFSAHLPACIDLDM